jgi:hypothetical protein
MAKVELPVERPTTKNLRNKLVANQKEIYYLENQDNVDSNRVRTLQNQIEKGVLRLIGSKEPNEQYMKVLEEIRKTAKNAPRPQSLLEKGIRKLMGKRGGGSVGYTQRWKNARKKNG